VRTSDETGSSQAKCRPRHVNTSTLLTEGRVDYGNLLLKPKDTETQDTWLNPQNQSGVEIHRPRRRLIRKV